MPNSYNGIPANAVAGLSAASTLLKTTVATPATIVTTTPHGMVTGDQAHIKNESLNVNENGIWPVNVIDSVTFYDSYDRQCAR
jgi:hypothetical protein